MSKTSNVAPPPFFSVFDPIDSFPTSKLTKPCSFKINIQQDDRNYEFEMSDAPVEELQSIVRRILKMRDDKKEKGSKTEKPSKDLHEEKDEKKDKKEKKEEKDEKDKDKRTRASAPKVDKSKTSEKTATSPSLASSSSSGIKDRRSNPGTLTKDNVAALAAAAAAAGTAGSTKVFGAPLAAVMDRQKAAHPELKVPHFVHIAIAHIIHRGVATEGLFRLSGTKGVIEDLKNHIDEGEEPKFTAVEDLHNISGLLKMYLRELPQPLLSSDYFQEILNIADFPPEMHALQMRKIIQQLPKHNQNLLVEMCWFMNIVAKNAEFNKMGLDNLGRVLGPNVLWHPESSQDLHKMQIESDRINMMTTILLQNWKTIFEGIATPAAEAGDLVLMTKFHTGHKKSVQYVCQSNPPYGKHIWSVDSAGIVRIHDLFSLNTVKELSLGKGSVFHMLALGTNMWIACERALLIYNSETYQLIKEDPIACFSIVHQREKELVWVSFLEGVRAYKREGLEQAVSFNTTTEVKTLCVSGNRLWIGGNKSLTIFDLETNTQIKEQRVHTRKINAIVELDGKVLTASDDMKIIIWDAETLECVKQLDGHTGKVIGLLAPRFTDHVFSSSWDCVLRIWTKTMEPVKELRGHHVDAISSIHPVWNSNENVWLLLSSSWDKFICVWRPKIQRPPELPPIAALPPLPLPVPGEAQPPADPVVVVPPSPSPPPVDSNSAPKRPPSQLSVLAPPPSLTLPPSGSGGNRSPSPGSSGGPVGRVPSGSVPLPPPTNLPKIASVNPSPPPSVLPPMPGQE